MDGAQVPRREISDTRLAKKSKVCFCQVGGRVKVIYYYCWEAVYGRPRVEQPLVQILVVVANTQGENLCLRTEVEKGFISIASTYE